MIIGVPEEVKNNEFRVALTTSGVHELVRNGHTVLVQPGETVEVIAEFARHRGRYLLHCHNVVHEDGGMMMNFEIK